ncbi:ferritin-like domain-containing protein [Pelomonas sp. CA6]|uniref:ferritin-like domain-containing protein n=1 Tax=Pelomonas sp. CA6 TaxID=2907999 RepID=UPI001F4C17EB|nr:ferritin-like domain-containing protein [Pelomonas sp. CA6]MCH7344615.1 ferritin-like domain-containing protein [Pelomonas sp. CA6]
MEARTELGHNRTGIQMSPVHTAEMLSGANAIADAIAPNAIDAGALAAESRAGLADAQLRRRYAREADKLGSVPLPGTLSGLAHTGADLLTGRRPQVLMDKLGERLAFERGGVRLYDGLLAKCQADGGDLSAEDVAAIRRFRDEEAQHFALVVQAIESLGGDPTAQTPCADLVGVESQGLVQALNDPRSSVLQALHVVLDAELLDNAGWELLVQLARAAGHDAIADRFAIAVQQEAEHLQTLQALVARLTLADAGATCAP